MVEGNFEYRREKTNLGSGGAAREETAVITGLLQERRFVEVPDRLGGLPVTGIAPHAFAERPRLRSVSLPASILSVGAFAFHNCPRLEEISLHDSIRDFHNGVVRQDRRLHRIRLTVHRGNYMVMRDILSDTDAGLQFCLLLPQGEARLLFPGYDYAFNENTMARTIQFSISGSGMVYRECVRRKGIQFREYDRLFPRVIPDDPHAALQIAADRLLYPYDLAPVHAKAYEDYLGAHAGQALVFFTDQISENGPVFLREEVCARLQMMADRGLICKEAADPALRLAAERNLPEVGSILLSGRQAAFKREEGSGSDPGSGKIEIPAFGPETQAKRREKEGKTEGKTEVSGQREGSDTSFFSLEDW